MNFIQSVEFYVIGSIALFCFSCGVLGGAFFSWLDGKMYLRKCNKRRELEECQKKQHKIQKD